MRMQGNDMLAWAKDLFPIARSLTGDGVRETIAYLQGINPELATESFSTGEQVFDWQIPQEWKICDAYIEHVETGQRFAEFSKSNLHLVGYSEPIDTVMHRDALMPHIYTQPDQPDLIPYVTSYYTRRWGFCMAHNEKAALPPGDYRVVVDSTLLDGELIVGDAVVRGHLKDEILFSSYVCHPSMVNNELSGPVLMMALLRHIKETYPSPRYSYRFILIPETIGSVAYMSRHLDEMHRNIVSGFNLSCVGDERAFSHVETRYGDTLADNALRAALFGRDNVKTYSFLQRGSDERQYGAPGIELPVAGFCRSKYGEFPEYHTSADNFDLVTAAGLQGAFDVMAEIIQAFEAGLYPRCKVLGEPQLGKRGLYPTISQKGTNSAIRTRMDFLTYADGSNTLFDLARIIGVPLRIVLEEAGLMAEHDLVSVVDHPSPRGPSRRGTEKQG